MLDQRQPLVHDPTFVAPLKAATSAAGENECVVCYANSFMFSVTRFAHHASLRSQLGCWRILQLEGCWWIFLFEDEGLRVDFAT